MNRVMISHLWPARVLRFVAIRTTCYVVWRLFTLVYVLVPYRVHKIRVKHNIGTDFGESADHSKTMSSVSRSWVHASYQLGRAS